MNRLRGIFALTLLALSGPVAAELIYITADALVDTERGKLLRNPAVLVEGNRILDVGTSESLSAPAGARSVDLAGHTLLPGLMDMHVHLGSASKRISFLEAQLQSVPRRTVNAVANAQTTLMAGLATIS